MRTIIGMLLVALVVTACGKKGPLVYPEMLVPAAPANVSVQQSGNSLKLSFMLPSKDRAGRNLPAANLAAVTVLKRDAMAGQPLGCSACTDEYSLFKKLNLDLLSPGVQQNGSLITLLDGDVHVGREYSYVVTAYTRDEIAGASSSPIPAALVPPPVPPVLQVTSQPTQIDLQFTGAAPSEGNFAGYNLYRAIKGEKVSYWPLNNNPLAANHYSDVGLERGVTYVYTVRAVTRSKTGFIVESDVSNQAEGQLKDDE